MTQYVSTIGYLEASYVIRKFLDAQRIHNLTSYLEQLHEQVAPLPLVQCDVFKSLKCSFSCGLLCFACTMINSTFSTHVIRQAFSCAGPRLPAWPCPLTN